MVYVRSPYRTVKALGAWAIYRAGYLRGRMLLAGRDWDALDLGRQIDVAEAVLGEGSPDDNLNHLEKVIAERWPTRAEWGASPQARAGMAAAEAEYRQADPLTDEQRAERERRKAERLAAAERESARTVEGDVPPAAPE